MKKQTLVQLSDEQQLFVDKALSGMNILVDACIGSGKTTAIQRLCCAYPETTKILYLTYNKLLKLDAKGKIKNKNVTVTNYHGFAYGKLLKEGGKQILRIVFSISIKSSQKLKRSMYSSLTSIRILSWSYPSFWSISNP